MAHAVNEATGARGWMSADMKPIFEACIAGHAVTALLRPVLKSDNRKYPNHALEILDQAPVGSVLVYVMQDGIDIAAMGNLMGTTAKVRNLAGAVIDGAVRPLWATPTALWWCRQNKSTLTNVAYEFDNQASNKLFTTLLCSRCRKCPARDRLGPN